MSSVRVSMVTSLSQVRTTLLGKESTVALRGAASELPAGRRTRHRAERRVHPGGGGRALLVRIFFLVQNNVPHSRGLRDRAEGCARPEAMADPRPEGAHRRRLPGRRPLRRTPHSPGCPAASRRRTKGTTLTTTDSTHSDLYYDPYDFAIDTDPYPIWRRLREERP